MLCSSRKKEDIFQLLLALVVKPFLSAVSPSQIGLRTDLLVSSGVLERGFDPCIDDKNGGHRSNSKNVQWRRVGHDCGGVFTG